MPIQILSTFTRIGVGNYPLILNTDQKGGFQVVTDIPARNAIQSALRQEGMFVWVNSAATLYQLAADLVTWNMVSFGGGPSVGLYDCPAGVNPLDAVHLSATDTVDQADADGAGKQPVIGFVRGKPDATHALVQYDGELGGFVGLSTGIYYLDVTPGGITQNVGAFPPLAIVQKICFARNATTIVIDVDLDYTIL
jgi:hypothetical protein